MSASAAADRPADEKPHYTGHRKRLRERFLGSGPVALADYELLEMILFPARPMGDVKPMAKALLNHFGSFAQVLLAEPARLREVEGVGEAAAVAIGVTRAAAERMLRDQVAERPVIKNWTQLLDYCRLHIGHAQNEEFHVLFLNHKLELLLSERQQKGTINHTPVYPREVVKRALELGASSIILVHNHPSGDVNPSKEDVTLTRTIVSAARALGIEVQDHIIVGRGKHFSFRSRELL